MYGIGETRCAMHAFGRFMVVLCSWAVTIYRPYRCMCRHVCATASVTASLPRSELAKNFWLTLSSASSGQSLNQSMVQQLIRDGNCRHLQNGRTTRIQQCWQTTHKCPSSETAGEEA